MSSLSLECSDWLRGTSVQHMGLTGIKQMNDVAKIKGQIERSSSSFTYMFFMYVYV